MLTAWLRTTLANSLSATQTSLVINLPFAQTTPLGLQADCSLSQRASFAANSAQHRAQTPYAAPVIVLLRPQSHRQRIVEGGVSSVLDAHCGCGSSGMRVEVIPVFEWVDECGVDGEMANLDGTFFH